MAIKFQYSSILTEPISIILVFHKVIYLYNSMAPKAARGATRKVTHGSQPMPGPAQCHPSIGNKVASHGCLPISILQKVGVQLGIPTTRRCKLLRKDIEAKLMIPPGAERTFLHKLPIPEQEKTDLARQFLRPAAPASWKADPDMWLDSNNISDTLNQYEEAYSDFEFMGPFPIDFAAPDPYQKRGVGPKCLMTEICELRVTKALQNGTKSVGIVYNLDPHFKSGSHWVANYIDIPGHKCYYFDSYGMAPPMQVARFMKWLTTQDPKMKLVYNSRRLQYSNTECGVYCIYFIIRMLQGDSFLQITRRKPRDADMLFLRSWLFST